MAKFGEIDLPPHIQNKSVLYNSDLVKRLIVMMTVSALGGAEEEAFGLSLLNINQGGLFYAVITLSVSLSVIYHDG